jgi:hypothetical protein
MPWKRAKALPPPDNSLFEACFRIQREASAAAGHHIPMVVENVCGAQKWVGRARWHYGSYYLWGDVPALMPMVRKSVKVGGLDWSKFGTPGYKAEAFNDTAIKNTGGRWFGVAHNKGSGHSKNPDGRNDPRDEHLKVPSEVGRRTDPGKGARFTSRDCGDERKQGGDWFSDSSPGSLRNHSSKSSKRKAASARIAKIPFPLSSHIAKVYKPTGFQFNGTGEST